MIKQLRIKFITATMILVAVMLLFIFTIVCNSTYSNMVKDNLRILARMDSEHYQNMLTDNQRKPPEKIPGICFILTKLPDGSLRPISDHEDNLPSQPQQQQLFQMAVDDGNKTGLFRNENVRYYRLDQWTEESYAFMDVTDEITTMWNLALNCIMVGLITLAVYFPIGWLMARVITKPVEQAMDQQRQFIADASHELKTPLTVILTNAELLQSPDYGAHDQQRFIDTVHTTAVRMRRLVENLLDLARLDQGSHLQHGTVDMTGLTEECCMLFEPVYFEAGRELVCEIAPNICLRGDDVKLQRLVDILLDNGSKYSEAGSQVTLQLQRQGPYSCVLQVSSHGQTLTAQQCRDIFKRFYRVDEVRTSSGSYGLGLPLAQQIVLEHRGKIWCTSKEGINTFFVQLPADKG